MKRGTLNYDFIIATILFLIVYVTMIQTSIYSFANIERGANPFTGESGVLTELLTKTPGYPPNWTEMSQVDQLGLTLYRRGNNPNILDQDKLEELDKTNCSVVREKTPLTTDVHLSITIQNETYDCNR